MKQNKKKNEAFETFRDPAVSVDTNPTLKHQSNQTLNETMINQLRYSHLGNNSFSNHTTNNIHCPVFRPQEIYKCQICSTLRQVCPKNRKHVMTNVSHSIQKNNKKIAFNYTDRPRTPQFHQHSKKEIFINSMPNITKNINRSKEVSPFQFPHSNNQKGSQDVSFIKQNYEKQQTNKFINVKPPMPNTKKIPTQQNHSNSLSYNVHRPWVDQKKTFINIPVPQQKVVIQEIVYVPVIKNVLVPQIIMNPQISQSFNTSNALLTPRNNLTSGTKSIYEHKFDQHVIMTPENLRKLAESIIR